MIGSSPAISALVFMTLTVVGPNRSGARQHHAARIDSGAHRKVHRPDPYRRQGYADRGRGGGTGRRHRRNAAGPGRLQYEVTRKDDRIVAIK